MSIAGNAAHAIITKGLSCGQTTACENGTMLVAGPFKLFCTSVVTPGGGGGGGAVVGTETVARPLQPGEISQLYQPVPDSQQYYVVPRDQEAQYLRQYTPIRIEVKIAGLEVEKQYMVPRGRAQAIFNTIEVINATKDRIQVSISNLKALTTKAVVKVTNFTLRRPKR